ncbi:MAG: hypothetical protein IJR77_02730 [Bacteroidales bacterium]|nr:hypothetical protein [Bacteroidales bacterium]
MDIDLLSKIIREIILDNDSVTLPGLGSFVAEMVPSTFTDRGYTINPPYRRLYFNRSEGRDTLLVDFYAQSNSISQDDAVRIVVPFLSQLREVLKEKKTVFFPGLGRLRATKENNFFFIADENLDIYPGGFGLAPISLKTHEETPAEVAAAVAGLASMVDIPEEIPEAVVIDAPTEEVVEEVAEEVVEEAAAEVPAEEAVEAPVETVEEAPVEAVEEIPVEEVPSEEPVEKGRGRRMMKRIVSVCVGVLAVAAVLLIAYVVVARMAPDFVDRILYTEEELQLLHL